MPESMRFPAFAKHPLDDGVNAFIFSNILQYPPNLTVQSVGTITIRVDSGADVPETTLVVGIGSPNATEFQDKDGNTVPVGHAALANVSGGTNGVNYLVTVPVTLSDGRVVAGDAPYYVRR